MFKPDATRVLCAVFVVAILLGQATLAILLGLLLLALGAARLWSRAALARVTYARELSTERAFVGDDVTLHLRVRNPKLLGLPGLRIRDLVSSRLVLPEVKLSPSSEPATRVMERFTSLRAYEAVGWQVAVRCVARGYYLFGPVHLEATDPWGLYSAEKDLADRTGLLVYPRLLPLEELDLDPRHPLGEIRAPRQLLTDPARTVGIRDYRRGDPFKAIHWGATAKRGELQTRLYEPTTSLELTIALDLDTFEQYWEGIQPELSERMISAAATIASAAARGRWSIGLYANCPMAGGDQFVRIEPSRSPAQLPQVLETLAKIVPFSITPMPQMLRRIGPALPWGSTLFLISALRGEALQHAIHRLAARGRRVLWLYCGPGEPPKVEGVDVRHLLPDSEWSRPRPVAAARKGQPGKARVRIYPSVPRSNESPSVRG